MSCFELRQKEAFVFAATTSPKKRHPGCAFAPRSLVIALGNHDTVFLHLHQQSAPYFFYICPPSLDQPHPEQKS